MKAILALILLLPLCGALFQALLGRAASRRPAEIAACAAIAGSFVCALAAFILGWEQSFTLEFFRWIAVDNFVIAADVFFNPLSSLMALMVTFVSGLIHVYSVGYMREDPDYSRYFCYLNLFVFSMLVIAFADNVVFLFVGWEGVGFCSYALIGFWYSDEEKASAGKKAFLLTRIGDVGFGVAIGLFFVQFSSTSITVINANAGQLTAAMATAMGLLLLWSAVGKSAQLPLTVWLPDAMAGPTPVSALIHAATMVTAGVYLLMRLYPVVALSPDAMTAVAAVGVVTALYAALSALGQRDIKKVLAYSTISQLGYMFLALGAGDISGSMGFLLSHAFYKSLLFLCAGCVIQALHEQGDIYAMGGLRRFMPGVFWLFLAGAVSLAALPPFGGFLNKDRVLAAVFGNPDPVFRVFFIGALAATFLTSLYAFRLFFCVFLRPQAETVHDVRPVPGIMTGPLWPLALLALSAGFLNFAPEWGGGAWLPRFLETVQGSVAHIGIPRESERMIAAVDALLALTAVLLAFVLYGPVRLFGVRGPDARQPARGGLFSALYLDSFYRSFIARPFEVLANILWHVADEKGVDRGIIRSAEIFPNLAAGIRFWTTGKLSTYLGMLFLGFVALLVGLTVTFYLGL
ncbi:MAG: NADH-quinone oxidoreductase subunit L [Desulfobacteraceae bacterium]|nr:NADH-quinone oxidoreductase subunit L [Desulfobacteraceae bacterium]